MCLTVPKYTFRTVDFRHTPPILNSQLYTLESWILHAITLFSLSKTNAEYHLTRQMKPKNIKHYLFFVYIIKFHKIVNGKIKKN